MEPVGGEISEGDQRRSTFFIRKTDPRARTISKSGTTETSAFGHKHFEVTAHLLVLPAIGITGDPPPHGTNVTGKTNSKQERTKHYG
jgi:hypothetical protein